MEKRSTNNSEIRPICPPLWLLAKQHCLLIPISYESCRKIHS